MEEEEQKIIQNLIKIFFKIIDIFIF